MNASQESESATQFAERTRAGFMRKADHNKRESLLCFSAGVFCTLVAPLFVTLGEGVLWGKVVPSALSLLAAGSIAWLQLRKPQQLWALYRDCQRRIEDHQLKYQYGLAEYSTRTDREVELADSVRQIAWDAHVRWLPLVPTPEVLAEPTKKNVSLLPEETDRAAKS